MSSMNPSGNANLAAALRKSLHDHWRLLLVEGIILVVLGLAAILVPPIAGLAATIFLGWLFLIGGIVGFVATLRARHAPGFWWALGLLLGIDLVFGGTSLIAMALAARKATV